VLSSHACGLYYRLQTFYKYKSLTNQPTDRNASHRRVVTSGVWFCITACKLFTNTTASPINQPIASHRRVVISCMLFCITACKLFTNTKASPINQPIATHRIAVLSSQVCGFVLPLANFLQIQKQHQSTNRSQRIASPCFHLMRVVLYYRLQTFYKYKSLITQTTEQNTESQILDAHFWSENGVSCPHERNKIGIQRSATESNASHRLVVISCVPSPKSPIPDLSSMHSNDVSHPYEHL
jgi:hypothetical protein